MQLGAALAAGVLAVAAAVLLWGFQEPGPAVVLAAVAVALPVVGYGRAQAAAPDGSMAALATLASTLELKGQGVHLVGPPGEGRVFIAASPEKRPPPEGPEVLHRGTPGGIGVTLPAPGAPLEAQWERRNGLPKGAGAEEAAQHLRRALPALDLARSVTVEAAPEHLRVRYAPKAHAEACRESREQAPWQVQGGCPTCSFIALVAARAFGRPMRFVSCQGDDEVTLELEAA